VGAAHESGGGGGVPRGGRVRPHVAGGAWAAALGGPWLGSGPGAGAPGHRGGAGGTVLSPVAGLATAVAHVAGSRVPCRAYPPWRRPWTASSAVELPRAGPTVRAAAKAPARGAAATAAALAPPPRRFPLRLPPTGEYLNLVSAERPSGELLDSGGELAFGGEVEDAEAALHRQRKHWQDAAIAGPVLELLPPA